MEDKGQAEVLRMVAAFAGLETIQGALAAFELLVSVSRRLVPASEDPLDSSCWRAVNRAAGCAVLELVAMIPYAVPPVPDLTYREGSPILPTPSDELAALGGPVASVLNLETVEALRGLLAIREVDLRRLLRLRQDGFFVGEPSAEEIEERQQRSRRLAEEYEADLAVDFPNPLVPGSGVKGL